MEALQKTLTRIFVSKRGKVPACMKLLSYVIVGGLICFIISSVMTPTNTKNAQIVEGLVNSEKSPSNKSKKIIYFYMDGCGHCVKFTPEWDNFCKNSPEKVTTEKLELKHPRAKVLLKEFGISGFPTVVMVDDKDTLENTFSGPRTVDGLNAFAQENL